MIAQLEQNKLPQIAQVLPEPGHFLSQRHPCGKAALLIPDHVGVAGVTLGDLGGIGRTPALLQQHPQLGFFGLGLLRSRDHTHVLILQAVGGFAKCKPQINLCRRELFS